MPTRIGQAAVERARRHVDLHPYEPPRWLIGAHAQTVWSPLFRPSSRLAWRLERLATPDDDLLRVHWLRHEVDSEAGASQRNARRRGAGRTGAGRTGADRGGSNAHGSLPPTVLLLHGLEGSVQSNYIGGQASLFARRGWNVAVLEFRTCGGEMNSARRMYHLGETSDLAFVVSVLAGRIRAGELGGPILLSGVSLGGNVIAKWLGEAPGEVPEEVGAAAAVSLPFDLEISGPHIDQALGGFYTWRFLRTLRRKAIQKEAQYPGCVDLDAIRRSTTFVEFDTHGTARLHGFQDAWDYWRRSSCGQFLPAIDRPMLLLASKDDPFNPAAAIPHTVIDANPWLVSQITESGGHVGFVSGLPWRTQHHSELQVDRFFATLLGSA